MNTRRYKYSSVFLGLARLESLYPFVPLSQGIDRIPRHPFLDVLSLPYYLYLAIVAHHSPIPVTINNNIPQLTFYHTFLPTESKLTQDGR
jgi:hypothetical protein